MNFEWEIWTTFRDLENIKDFKHEFLKLLRLLLTALELGILKLIVHLLILFVVVMLHFNNRSFLSWSSELVLSSQELLSSFGLNLELSSFDNWLLRLLAQLIKLENWILPSQLLVYQ
jgi:hypothetical protein